MEAEGPSVNFISITFTNTPLNGVHLTYQTVGTKCRKKMSFIPVFGLLRIALTEFMVDGPSVSLGLQNSLQISTNLYKFLQSSSSVDFHQIDKLYSRVAVFSGN